MNFIKKLLVSILLFLTTLNGTAFAVTGVGSNGAGGIGTPTSWIQKNGEAFLNIGQGLGIGTINVTNCNGCGNGLSSVLTDGVTIIGDGLNNPLTAVQFPDNKLISGGASWSGTGYTYDVSALTYYFDGFYASAPTQVTLAAADPADDRFDAIVVDQAGTVSVITGTPSGNPASPAIPDTQLLVQYVYVAAGTTTPVILQDLIYDENTGSPTEWATSTYTTGTGATGTIDFNASSSCKNGTKCMDAVSNQRLGAKFTRATAIDIKQFAYVQVWYRNVGAPLASNKTPSIRFDNSLGNPVGNNVSLLNYGVSRTVVGTWQLAVIPVSAFGSVTQVKGLRAIVTGGTLASQASWSLDFMLASGGILPQSATGPIYLSSSGTLYSTGAGNGATTATDSLFFGNLSGFQATNANDSFFIGKNSGKNALNANNSLFIGADSGNGAINADHSIFLGENSGISASSAYSSVFIGADSGSSGLNSYQSVFIGRGAGSGATNASDSFFLGYNAGLNASAANSSAFLGSESGSGATNAAASVFLGHQAGKNATDATASIFIGALAGLNDTATQAAIGIGYQSSSGGFNQSIALGTTATNTANNQMVIGASLFPINTVIINGTGGIQVPVGTTGERSATQGTIRYNTTTSKFEGYDGATWVDLN